MQSSLPRLQWRLLLREPAPRIGVLVLLLGLAYALVRGITWTAMDAREATEAEAAASLAVKQQEVEDIEAGRVDAAQRPYAGSPLDYHVTATLPHRPLAALAVPVLEPAPVSVPAALPGSLVVVVEVISGPSVVPAGSGG